MSSDAWSGEYSNQLQEIYETILKDEETSGKTITYKDKIDIKAEVEDAYEGIIDCFEKENVDPSLIAYAINLMKSTVSSTNDLRNISQIAVAVSQSTIGALYLVRSLEEREKLGVLGLVEENDENKKINEILEKLTQKIEVNISPEILEEITSEKNEEAFAELKQKAVNGDENAKIALSFIRKSANFISNNQTGRLNADTKDLAALILVGKITELGEDIALLSATQLIREFGLDKYDIYDLDENGNPYISADKIKVELQKEFGKKGMNHKAELILGLEREQANLELIDELNNAAETRGENTLFDVHMFAKKSAEIATFRHDLAQIADYKKEGMIGEYNSFVNKLVVNNSEIAKDYLKYTIDFQGKYSIKDKNLEIYSRIGEVSTALKEVSTNDKFNNYKTKYITDKNNPVKLENLISAEDNKKYNDSLNYNKITPSDDEAR